MQRKIWTSILLLAACLLAPLSTRAQIHFLNLRSSQPAELHATPQMAGSHSVALTWTASTDAAANPTLTYNAYRGIGATCTTTTVLVQIATKIATTSYTDAGLQPGAYCYAVTSFLNGAESVDSNLAPAVVPPSPPSALATKAS